MNLSIEDNPEYDKENVDEVIEKPPKKSPVKKTPYYDKYEYVYLVYIIKLYLTKISER